MPHTDEWGRPARHRSTASYRSGVVADQCVGAVQDGGGGAVVLFQTKQFRVWKVAPELMQILHARAAPAIDGLVVIAHRKGLHRAPGKQFHPAVLDGIGVLELIDEHMPEALPVVIQQRGLVAPQFKCAQQQLREVDHAGARAGLLVVRVQADQLAAGRIVAVLEVFGPVTLVLV
jgi:hypothetical protein